MLFSIQLTSFAVVFGKCTYRKNYQKGNNYLVTKLSWVAVSLFFIFLRLFLGYSERPFEEFLNAWPLGRKPQLSANLRHLVLHCIAMSSGDVPTTQVCVIEKRDVDHKSRCRIHTRKGQCVISITIIARCTRDWLSGMLPAHNSAEKKSHHWLITVTAACMEASLV